MDKHILPFARVKMVSYLKHSAQYWVVLVKPAVLDALASQRCSTCEGQHAHTQHIRSELGGGRLT